MVIRREHLLKRKRGRRRKKDRFELRTRVTFFLPSDTSRERSAVEEFIDYLKGKKRSATPVTGFTHSPLDVLWNGYWWSRRKRHWVPDNVVSFTIDYLASEDRLHRSLDGLRDAIKARYRKYGCRQEDVWITSQRVTRHM